MLPILPRGVSWTCVKSTDDTLDVVSKQGVPGVACDCRMLFEIQEMNRDETSVELTMEYEPVNVLGTFAIPILTIDNALALKVLLPYRLQQMHATPLVKFQQLMGILYGIAGVAHFVDLVFGESQILKLSGCAPFGELPWSGQVLALIWCAAGPIAFVCSRIAGLENADIDWIWFDGSVLQCTRKLNNDDVIDESIVERAQRSNSRSRILCLLIKKEP